jgi:gluconokinase
MDHVILGLDLGTTHVKSVLFSTDGETVLLFKERVETIRTGLYCAEQDPIAYWQKVTCIIKQLLSNSNGISPSALCISGAMQSLLPIDGNGNPLTNAWIWSDFRSFEEAREIRGKKDSRNYYLQTGCPLQPVYHPSRLGWVRRHNPEVFAAAKYWVGLKEYIIHQLTGSWCMDTGMASSTGLFDIQLYKWNEELLKLCGVRFEQLPQVMSPSEIAGFVTEISAKNCGLTAGLPVVIGSTDGILANYGAGACNPGDTVISVATGSAVRIWSESPWFDPQERTWAYIFHPGEFINGGAGNNGGLAIQWVREQFYKELDDEEAYKRFFDDASSVDQGANGIRFEPYFNGNRTPYWNAELTASICGLTGYHNRQHIARAALEGVAREVKDIWIILEKSGLSKRPIMLTGPFCDQPVWIEILESTLGVKLIAVNLADASAIGSAKLAANVL